MQCSIIKLMYFTSGYGRLTNLEYRKFLRVLMEVQKPNHQHTARVSMLWLIPSNSYLLLVTLCSFFASQMLVTRC